MATQSTTPAPEKRTYLFPELGVSVEATDLKEAEKKALELTKESK